MINLKLLDCFSVMNNTQFYHQKIDIINYFFSMPNTLLLFILIVFFQWN